MVANLVGDVHGVGASSDKFVQAHVAPQIVESTGPGFELDDVVFERRQLAALIGPIGGEPLAQLQLDLCSLFHYKVGRNLPW